MMCVCGQRKNNKNRQHHQANILNSTLSSVFNESSVADVTSTSLMVNTSQMNDTQSDFTCTENSTFTNDEDKSVSTVEDASMNMTEDRGL